jgi:hypothetical protein
MDVEHQTRRPAKTIRMRDLHFWADYYDLATHRRIDMAARIIDALDCPEWQRSAMKTWHPPVHARSQWINNTVRANAVGIEESRGERGEPDPGYLRAFERARQEAKTMRSELKALFQQQAA